MLADKMGFVEASSLPTSEYAPMFRAGNTLVSNIRPYFKKIIFCQNEGGCSADVLCFVAKDSIYDVYVFETLFSDQFFAYVVAGSKGTKMPRGDKQQIMNYPIYIPSDEELKYFNSIVYPLLTKKSDNEKENRRLAALRDALLPRLMSGELDVSSLEI